MCLYLTSIKLLYAISELRNLKKYFATQKAVDDISFTIEKGQHFRIVRAQWRRKDDADPMITGIFFPDEGEIIFDGKKFDPINDIINIGYMPEERGLYKK
jgi:ABC-2 type transport system ATP-binding protein